MTKVRNEINLTSVSKSTDCHIRELAFSRLQCAVLTIWILLVQATGWVEVIATAAHEWLLGATVS